ncbi:hypothetical protein H5410_063988 [Solanum commersonii]|uniref:Uncharacterized protein n=1 Tax=Solanum commersonii TaxID=4109 RepID=A0A9J5W0Q0_SOLCO|nr:hypothetical protein H5410_063988 [Solanum commersonii]
MRGGKATLPLTIPVGVFKSSQRILPAASMEIVLQAVTRRFRRGDLTNDRVPLGAKGPTAESASGRRARRF